MTTHLSAKDDKSELVIYGYIRLYINKKADQFPSDCCFVCKMFFGPDIDSTIMTDIEKSILAQWIREQTTKSNWKWKLILRETNGHGSADKAFKTKCRNKSNTVIIIHNSSDQVFGGYTKYEWKECPKYANVEFIKDDAESTFLFILRTELSHGPALLPLKQSRNHRAISYRRAKSFCFGCGDFSLQNGGIFALGKKHDCCFDWSCINTESVYLGGQHYSSQPSQIEVFQLKK